MSKNSPRRRIWIGIAAGILIVAGGLISLTLTLSASARSAAGDAGDATTHRHHVTAVSAHASTVTVNSTVGTAGFVDVGGEAEGCTSAAPNQVACGVPDSTSTVKYWCLGATPPAGVALTVTASESAPVNQLSVVCDPRPAPTVGFPGTIGIQLFTATSEYENESCSTNVAGVSCSTPDSSNTVDVTCSPGIPAGTATVTVTASGPVEVAGKSISFDVNCPGGTPLNVSSTAGSGGQVDVGGEVEDCTSAAPNQVACGVFDSDSVVKYWCLSPTPAGGVIITANPSESAPVASVTVNCGAFPVPTIRIPGSARVPLYSGTKYEAEDCGTDTAGVSCSVADSSNILTVTCTAGAPAGPATITATGSDPTEVAGKTTSFQVDCQ
jgi:hypothetical protein